MIHEIPILPFNLFGTSKETHQIQSNKQGQICKKEKETKNYVLDHKKQATQTSWVKIRLKSKNWCIQVCQNSMSHTLHLFKISFRLLNH